MNKEREKAALERRVFSEGSRNQRDPAAFRVDLGKQRRLLGRTPFPVRLDPRDDLH
jgi:hypothetical protein